MSFVLHKNSFVIPNTGCIKIKINPNSSPDQCQGSGLVGNKPLVVRMIMSKIQSHPLHNAQMKTN